MMNIFFCPPILTTAYVSLSQHLVSEWHFVFNSQAHVTSDSGHQFQLCPSKINSFSMRALFIISDAITLSTTNKEFSPVSLYFIVWLWSLSDTNATKAHSFVTLNIWGSSSSRQKKLIKGTIIYADVILLSDPSLIIALPCRSLRQFVLFLRFDWCGVWTFM